MAEDNFVQKTLDKLLEVVEVEFKIPLGFAEIKFPVTDHAKKWWKNKKNRQEIEKAIQRAEEKFIADHKDQKVAQMLHELPLHSEDEFRQVIAGLLIHLSEEKITWLAEINLTKTWKNVASVEDIRKALEQYLPYLRHELNGIKEFREVISALTLERIEKNTKKIDKTTERIEGKLDKVLKSKQPKTIALQTGWFYGHRYGDLENFTGRAAEMTMFDEWLGNDKDNLLVLRALGGFGKSALTWQWFNNKVDKTKWQTAVWWSFYEKESGFESFLAETLKHLGIEVKDSVRQQLNDLLEAMRGTNILIVLDGFERLLRQYGRMDAALQSDDEDADIDPSQRDCSSPLTETFLRGLSGAGMKSKVLMTTRLCPRVLESADGKLLKGCREVELNAMSKADAVEFFHKQGIKGRRDEIESACETYGFHPLSLTLLVGFINEEEHEHRGDIQAIKNWKSSGDIKARRHHVLENAYRSLAPERRDLLSKISCFRGSIEYAVLKKVFPNPDLDKALLDLRKRGLLQQISPLLSGAPFGDDKGSGVRYDLHPIVRHYAYDHFTDEKRRKEAHVHIVNYFKGIPKPKKVNTLEDLTPMIELYHQMVRAGDLDDALKLYYDQISEEIYYQFSAYQLCIELMRVLFLDGEDKPPRLKTDDYQSWTLNTLANAYSLSGQPRVAILLYEVVNTLKKTGSKKNLAVTLGNIADTQSIIGALSAAEHNLRRQIDLSREIADELLEALGHQELGRILSYRGVWQEAEQELEVAEKVFDKYGSIQTNFVSVIRSYRALRFLLIARANNQSKIINLKSSIENAQHALKLAGEFSRQQFRVEGDYIHAYWLLGSAYRANNELTLAEENLSKALNLCRQINMVDHEANILLDVARLRYAQGDFKDAQEKASEALMITERSGYVLQGADVNLFLATLALEGYRLERFNVGDTKNLSDKEVAILHAKEALKLAYCDGPPYYYKVAYEEAERFLENLK